MRLCRFNDDRVGVILDDKVADVSDTVHRALPSARWPFPPGDMLMSEFASLRPQLEKDAESGKKISLSSAKLLSPVANPGKVIAAPVNYKKHIDESIADAGIHHQNEVHPIDRYSLFLKANSSVVGASHGVERQHPGRRVDHEIELGLVIGKTVKYLSEETALDCVAGYIIGLDMTVRGTEDRSYRKSMDSYTVLGPWLVTPDEFGDPSEVDFELKVNGETRQKANTRDLIWSIRKIISVASHAYTLHPGDVIISGTPEGVGPVEAGDKMWCQIDGIGEMVVDIH
jgi:2-keto-4-pentenoate hydratase/2-oxohepta-3-ene-1,7-dioic acid hydratase in catechol pathway